MSDECTRCKQDIIHHDNVMETSVWGLIQRKTETTVRKSLRVVMTHIYRKTFQVLHSDDEQSLCDPCMGLLVGRFLQGRDVVAVDHEHVWKQLNKYPILDRCERCYQTRITDSPEGDQ